MKKKTIIIFAMGIFFLGQAQEQATLSICKASEANCDKKVKGPNGESLCDSLFKDCLLLTKKEGSKTAKEMYRSGQIFGIPMGVMQPESSKFAIIPIGKDWHVMFRRPDNAWERIILPEKPKTPPLIIGDSDSDGTAEFLVLSDNYKYPFTWTGNRPKQGTPEKY